MLWPRGGIHMWRKLVIGVVFAVASISVLIGLLWPDGDVGGKVSTLPSASPSTSAATTSSATPEPEPGEVSPVSISSSVPWPGLPNKINVSGGSVDWCAAAPLEPASGTAVAVFGAKAVDTAYCDVLSFLFEQRFGALAVPRKSYSEGDFSPLRDVLSQDAYDNRFLPKAKLVIADPDNGAARKDIGLLMFHLSDDRPGSGQLSAGSGRVFYGKGAGYRERAVWINPTWKRIGLTVDRRIGSVRISITVRASAALPVYNTAAKRDDMMEMKTEATFFLKKRTGDSGRPWRIDGWRIVTQDPSFKPLVVANG